MKSPDTSQVTERKLNRPELPVDKYKEQFLEIVDGNESIVGVGEPGSGKTTAWPVFLMEKYPGSRIAVTSPRAIPAAEVSSYVSKVNGSKLGDSIGVLTREKKFASKKTQVTYMTDGILLNMLQTDPLLSDLDIVMVDEAHERGVNCDLSLGMLKIAQEKRREQGLKPLKIIIASATIDAEKFADYLGEAPTIKVPGNLYEVSEEYSAPRLVEGRFGMEPMPVTEHAAEVVSDIVIHSKTSGDILVFMPGEAEVNQTITELESIIGARQDVEIYPLYRALPSDQKEFLQDRSSGKRRIIVGTNIMETSLTIPRVTCVVDSMLEKRKSFYPASGVSKLELCKISKASAKQRMRRAGRTEDGMCVRLCEENDFESLEAQKVPEMAISDVAEVVLKIKGFGINDVEHFPFLDAPDSKRIEAALDKLKRLDAIDENGMITDLGRKLLTMPVTPEIGRMVLKGIEDKNLLQAIHLAAILTALSGKYMFRNVKANSPDYNDFIQKKIALTVRGSDCVSYMKIYLNWLVMSYKDRREFEKENYLNRQTLEQAEKNERDIYEALKNSNIDVEANSNADLSFYDTVTSLLLAVFKDDFYKKSSYSYSGEYHSVTNIASQPSLRVFPGALSSDSAGEFIVAPISSVFTNDNDNTFTGIAHTVKIEDMQRLAPHLVNREEVISETDYYVSKRLVVKYQGVIIKEEILSQVVKPWDPSRNFASTLSDDPASKNEYYFANLQSEKYGKNIEGAYEDVMRERNDINTRLRLIDDDEENYYSYNRFRKICRKLIEDGTFTDSTDEQVVEYFEQEIEKLKVSEEHIKMANEVSPKEVLIGGSLCSVDYSYNVYSKKYEATISVTEAAIGETLKHGVQINLHFDMVDILYFRSPDYSRYENFDEMLIEARKRKARIELDRIQREQRYKTHIAQQAASAKRYSLQERKAREESLYRDIPEYPIFDLKGKISNKGKKDEAKLYLELAKDLLSMFDFLVSKSDGKIANKLKNQLKDARKDISTAYNLIDTGTLEADKVVDCVKYMKDVLTKPDVVTMFEATDAKYLGGVLANIRVFKEVSVEGGIELTKELNEKIYDMVISFFSSGDVKILSKEEVEEWLIENI